MAKFMEGDKVTVVNYDTDYGFLGNLPFINGKSGVIARKYASGSKCLADVEAMHGLCWEVEIDGVDSGLSNSTFNVCEEYLRKDTDKDEGASWGEVQKQTGWSPNKVSRGTKVEA